MAGGIYINNELEKYSVTHSMREAEMELSSRGKRN